MTGQNITLSAGSARLDLNPANGGSVQGWQTVCHGEAFSWLAQPVQPVFPLVPFASRIAQGRFQFAGRHIRLHANLPGEVHAIHGQGWQRAWQIVEQQDSIATLRYTHQADAWPWAYVAEQRFELSEQDLTLTLSVQNSSNEAMPAGIGLHPHFFRSPQVSLTAQAHACWHLDAALMPSHVTPPDAAVDLRSTLALRKPMDAVYGAWDGEARLYWPERRAGLHLRASECFRYLVVYAPAEADFVCVEPVSNLPDGFNRMQRGEPEHGVVILDPGARLCGEVTLSIVPD